MATPTSEPTMSARVWQILTGLATALLIAAVSGLFNSAKNEPLRDEKIARLTLDVAELKATVKDLENKAQQQEIHDGEIRSTVSNVKESLDELKAAARRQR